jgi:hypothetical protein
MFEYCLDSPAVGGSITASSRREKSERPIGFAVRYRRLTAHRRVALISERSRRTLVRFTVCNLVATYLSSRAGVICAGLVLPSMGKMIRDFSPWLIVHHPGRGPSIPWFGLDLPCFSL